MKLKEYMGFEKIEKFAKKYEAGLEKEEIKELKGELEKINLLEEELAKIVKKYSSPYFGDLSSSHDSTDLESEYYFQIIYLLELALMSRNFNLKKYLPHQIEFYIGCRANDLIDKEDFNPEKVVSTFNEYNKLYHLKPKGKVLEEFLKLPKEIIK